MGVVLDDEGETILFNAKGRATRPVYQAESSAGALGGEVAQLLNSCSVEFLQHSHQ
jgi:hypothetical protein